MLTREFATWILVFVRVGAMLAVVPLFSVDHFPRQIRLATGAIVAFLMVPVLPPVSLSNISLWSLVGVTAQEVTAGLVLGFVCRIAFFAVEMAGSIIANDIGLNMASTLNPMVNSPMAPTSTALYWMGVAIMLSLDLHHVFIAGFQRSYDFLPMGGSHMSEALLHRFVSSTGGIFVSGLQMAAPIMAVTFVITLVFSLLGRAVPQMNVFAESMPVKLVGGMIVFGLTCSLMGEHIINLFHRIPEEMLRFSVLMGQHTS
ncbi:MAG TPA: flagellar biosynthetic protein FliR [Candidatus Limnocylindria bacterium]|jgi:flagellar biosynthetic protein FliR|nr:flagellar biosynthetic protein FliR [Candidatus Limnocylindria bacterium]